MLVPVYEALGLPGGPRPRAPLPAEDAALGWSEWPRPLIDEYAREHELVEDEVDAETLELARRLAPEHVPPG